VTRRAVIDVETRSELSLPRTGPRRYAEDSTTEPLCLAYAIDDEPVRLWLPGDPLPAALAEALADPACRLVGHNARGFEHLIFRHVLTRPPYGWPSIPLERWDDTAVRAAVLGLPRKLGLLAKVLSLKHQKMADGIMHRMTKPLPPGATDDPADLTELYAYNKADVACERELDDWLPPLSEAMWQQLNDSDAINETGIYFDGELINKALAITSAVEHALCAEIKRITDSAITSQHQVARMLAWLKAHGCEVDNLQRPTLSAALRRKDLAPEARRVLEIRREAAHASATKFAAMRNWRCADGRIYNCFVFHGAATGRWSAGGVQIQNFRKETDDIAAEFAAVMDYDEESQP
jgi:DNA polymerase